MKKIFLISSILLFMRNVEAWELAWFLTIEYTPSESSIYSIPVSQIDNTWTFVKVLTKESIPKESLAEFETYNDPYGYRFSVEGDFNGDKVKDTALVGVYENNKGEKGRFLLILTQDENGNWKKAFLKNDPGNPGFGVLTYNNSRLHWSDCMECDVFNELKWNGKEYSLEYFSCCGED